MIPSNLSFVYYTVAELQSLKAKKQSHLGHLEVSVEQCTVFPNNQGNLRVKGAKELVNDDSKQVTEKARSELAQVKQQLDSQVHVGIAC